MPCLTTAGHRYSLPHHPLLTSLSATAAGLHHLLGEGQQLCQLLSCREERAHVGRTKERL